ncbi:Alginate lyase [Rhizoctonia solani]|uniref:Alginate lyase n=1 Tax=Rhizoctonia solani TaxID=456999 RepID=A0A8H7M1A8_9AGAM|nr:Alginate lyase [Rhizoctonia solani]
MEFANPGLLNFQSQQVLYWYRQHRLPQATSTTTRSVSPSSVPAQGIAAKVLPLGFGKSANSWTTVRTQAANTMPWLTPAQPFGPPGYSAVLSPQSEPLQMAELQWKSLPSIHFVSTAMGPVIYHLGTNSHSAILSSSNLALVFVSLSLNSTQPILTPSIYLSDFVHGGKLPGLYGGTSNDEAASCSGGRKALTCFSTRFMWRDEGAGEVYVYLPNDPANKFLCNGAGIPGKNICASDYGTSLGRGSFYFKAGQWNYVSQRIKLNTPGKANGELQATYILHAALAQHVTPKLDITSRGKHLLVSFTRSSVLSIVLFGITGKACGPLEESSFAELEWMPVVCEASWSKVSLADMKRIGPVEKIKDCGLQTLASRNSVDGTLSRTFDPRPN